MKLVEKVKLKITKLERDILLYEMGKYVQTVNMLIHSILDGSLPSYPSCAKFDASLQSSIKTQCVRTARELIVRYRKNIRKYEQKRKKFNDCKNKKIKESKLPTMKKLVYYVNNQNFKIKGDYISFPFLVNGKSKRLSFRLDMTERQRKLLEGKKLGLLRICMKNNKMMACIQYEVEDKDIVNNGKVMGIDLGVKCPAVSYDTNGKIRFYGNGRKNRYIRRKFFEERRKLQRKKKYRVIKRRKNKERRIMRDVNHKISRQIINEALKQGVSMIKMERLKNIRKGITKRATRTSRKNKRSKYNKFKMMVRRNNRFVNSWSFGQLQKFIAYKAMKAGIQVVYVNPKNTSKECPVCHALNQSNDRKYTCNCGFHKHRDVVGAMNIYASTKVVGNRQSA